MPRGRRFPADRNVYVCRVHEPGQEPQDLVTPLPPEVTFSQGIIPEAIVGVHKRCLEDGGAIEPEHFVRNKVFNDFMHEVIARHGPELDGLRTEARR